MLKLYSIVAIAALLVAFDGSASAQSIENYPYEKVCVPPPKGSPAGAKAQVSYDKLRATTGIDANKFFKDGEFDREAYRKALKDSIFFLEQQLAHERGRFYKVYKANVEVSGADLGGYVDNPKDYRITCENYGKPASRIAEARKDISKALNAAGNRLIVRKDLASITKRLSNANPAMFSFTSDRVADNRRFQSHFAVASEYTVDIKAGPNSSPLALDLLPYIRHEGVLNSNNRAKDVDNLAIGLLAELYPLRLADWLGAGVSLSGEYLTDSANDKEVLASELVVQPFARNEALWGIPINDRMFFDPLAGGPSVAIDLSGRLRYGRVEQAGPVPTLQSGTEYLRVGYRAGIDFDLGGSDTLSGLTFSAAYVYFSNFDDASALDRIERFETALNYAITPSFGIGVGYERGRNEDSLQEVDKVTAGLTVKFGDIARNSKPSF
jgi:hypothetical protein